MTSEVVFVDDDDRQSVLKRCHDPRYIAWIQREHYVLTALSECGLRIPRVLGYHEIQNNARVVDVWLLMTRLPGERLWDVLLRSEPNKRSGYFRKLGQLLCELHSTAVPEAFRGKAGWADRMLEKAWKNLAWCDGSSALLSRLEAKKPAPVRELLIHGDMALENVLVDSDGNMALIDWPFGDLGDPRCDIALALSTEPELHLSEAEIAAFYKGHGGEQVDAITRRWFEGLYEFF